MRPLKKIGTCELDGREIPRHPETCGAVEVARVWTTSQPSPKIVVAVCLAGAVENRDVCNRVVDTVARTVVRNDESRYRQLIDVWRKKDWKFDSSMLVSLCVRNRRDDGSILDPQRALLAFTDPVEHLRIFERDGAFVCLVRALAKGEHGIERELEGYAFMMRALAIVLVDELRRADTKVATVN